MACVSTFLIELEIIVFPIVLILLTKALITELNGKQAPNKRVQQTIGSPHITILSEDSAVIAYSRIVQYQDW